MRPKHEVQSAHFPGKQFTLHCAIAEPFDTRYHYHLSDDTIHDGIFVNQVLRDLVLKYDIHDEDLWIQSDNASCQYKNKRPFGLLQRLANEFNLRIFRTYGAAGHGKGVIDAMSSVGVKNVLRKDIITHDVFFNTSEDIQNHLSFKNPHFYYTAISPANLTSERQAFNSSIELANCMKQHMIVSIPYGEIIYKENLCDCTSCLQLKFSDFFYIQVSPDYDCDTSTVNELESEDGQSNGGDEIIDRNQQVFDFVEVPSYVSLITGNIVEPLYFVKITEKGIAEKDMYDPYDHFIGKGEWYFKAEYLKQTSSRKLNFKQFEVLHTDIIISPDAIFDTHVDINDDSMQINVNLYNSLMRKASQ